jgi:hypothetical protein
MWLRCLPALAMVSAAIPIAQSAAGDAAVFDRPLSVKRVALPKTAEAPDKNELTCFYFKELRVKQLDQGEVGAAELAILPLSAPAQPPCERAAAKGEIVIPGKDWSGYFKGVRHGFVLFDADDGTNGGLGFAVFDGDSGKKLFEDLAVGDMHAAGPAEDGITLRYRRAAAASCSLLTGGAACWEKTVAAVPELKEAGRPDCAAGYRAAKTAMAQARCEAHGEKDAACLGREMQLLDKQRWDESPSVIGYEAEARITRTGHTVARLGRDLSCWPSD